MKPLFKYLRRAHALALVERGALRIGTLYGYQDTEKHGLEVGDAEEGTKSTYSDDPHIDWKRPETVNQLARSMISAPPGTDLIIEDCLFEQDERCPDAFVYSVSSVADEVVMRRMKYDACVAIMHPERFFHVLSEHLLVTGRVIGRPVLVECVYQGRRVHYAAPRTAHPAQIKDPKHAYQRELRMIGEPSETPIKPLLMELRALVGCCELRALP